MDAPDEGRERSNRPAGAPRRSRSRRAADALVRSAMRLGFPVLKAWWRVRRPTLEGVYVAVWHEGRVLLIRNSYQRAFSFPSGRRGRREPPARAAARELHEEVGLRVAEAELTHVAEWTVETRLIVDHVHVFEWHAPHEPAVAPDHREVSWAAFEPPERARERPLLPVVRRYFREAALPLAPPRRGEPGA